MATKAASTVNGTYVKDTAKGKKHYSISSLDEKSIVGAVYLSPNQYKAMGEPKEILVTVDRA